MILKPKHLFWDLGNDWRVHSHLWLNKHRRKLLIFTCPWKYIVVRRHPSFYSKGFTLVTWAGKLKLVESSFILGNNDLICRSRSHHVLQTALIKWAVYLGKHLWALIINFNNKWKLKIWIKQMAGLHTKLFLNSCTIIMTLVITNSLWTQYLNEWIYYGMHHPFK